MRNLLNASSAIISRSNFCPALAVVGRGAGTARIYRHVRVFAARKLIEAAATEVGCFEHLTECELGSFQTIFTSDQFMFVAAT